MNNAHSWTLMVLDALVVQHGHAEHLMRPTDILPDTLLAYWRWCQESTAFYTHALTRFAAWVAMNLVEAQRVHKGSTLWQDVLINTTFALAQETGVTP